MGLDAVELVMRWEEEFGIDIPDSVAARLETPRQAIDYIWTQLDHASEARCREQRVFYVVRNSLLTKLAFSRHEVHPSTRLDALIPRASRRALWRELPAATGLPVWPELQRPQAVRLAVVAVALTASTAALIGSGFTILPGAAALALGAAAAYLATMPLADAFPPHQPTMRGLTMFLSLHNAGVLAKEDGGWSRARVREIVRFTICDQLCVPDDFDDNAHFVRDLGVD